jgi:acyl dehydratase
MITRHFEQLPKPYAAYGKILLGFIKGQPKTKTKVLPQSESVVDRLVIDQTHLQAYNELCGFKQQGILPPTYLAVLSQSLQVGMMTDPSFPFPVLGLVHVRNSVSQKRPIKTSEVLRLSCKFGDLKPHDKGLEFDFITTATVDNNVVWSGVSTYLVRQKTVASGVAVKPANKPSKLARQAGDVHGVWPVPENIGRRYGMVSGDINMIHMHAMTAKVFGFPKAIAHGMWTKARCLAALGDLPDAYDVDVQFKLPVFLPAQVEFTAHPDQSTVFELNDAKSGKPHLAGSLTKR